MVLYESGYWEVFLFIRVFILNLSLLNRNCNAIGINIPEKKYKTNNDSLSGITGKYAIYDMLKSCFTTIK